MNNRRGQKFEKSCFFFCFLSAFFILGPQCAYCKDYTKICKSFMSDTHYRNILKKTPIIVFPEESQTINWEKEKWAFSVDDQSYKALFKDGFVYILRLPVVICRDPDQKRIMLNFQKSTDHTLEKLPQLDHEMFSNEKTPFIKNLISFVVGTGDVNHYLIGAELTIRARYEGHQQWSSPVYFRVWEITEFPFPESNEGGKSSPTSHSYKIPTGLHYNKGLSKFKGATLHKAGNSTDPGHTK